MNIWLFVQILSLMVSPFIYYSIGDNTIYLIRRLIKEGQDENIPTYVKIMFGLCIWCNILFFIFHFGAPLFIALLVSSALSLPRIINNFRTFTENLFNYTISINFALWSIIILILGLSLFEVNNGIKTLWLNNYGDLAFHLGMINSFVFGGNSGPEYHIFPHVTLSYPFYVNLWTASFWGISPNIKILPFIFTFQWVLLWQAIYFVLSGDKNKILPWALLLCGGTYGALGDNYGVLISNGHPWTSVISTIWVTQRAALFGIAITLVCCRIIFDNKNSKISTYIIAGLMVGLSPLIHTHIAFIGGTFISLLLCYDVMLSNIRNNQGLADNLSFKYLLIFLSSSLVSLVFLPWLIGKSEIIRLSAGWMAKENSAISIGALLDLSKLWLINLWPFFIPLIAILILDKKHLAKYFILGLLFIIFNFVIIAIWEWDQIKIYLALYAIILLVMSLTKLQWWQILLFVPTMVPSLIEVVNVGRKYDLAEIYSTSDISMAKDILSVTPPEAIIASNPIHNSVITLTGRKMFVGYDGTLFSHGIDSKKRQEFFRNLEMLSRCSGIAKPVDGVCPDFILFTDSEKRFWGVNQVPSSLEELRVSDKVPLYILDKGQN